ncbi:hypothetical protein Plec18167_000650 [Paecilomyces lecythidis]|uniref:Uncharacterized protein n=1 Tax=Paecilomyces lecythidis TaxID=3004212 RepID=A0ABR3YEJ6_9EURO
MKASTVLSFLLPAAAVLAAETPDAPTAVEVNPAPPSMITPAPVAQDAPEGALEAREVVAGAAAAQPTDITQAGSVTTYWAQTVLPDDKVTYVPVTYTQTFADVPDQWPAPSSGSIGMGTLTGTIGETKAMKARSVSEGTLGQTPWIGMALGLTATALAAIMLG